MFVLMHRESVPVCCCMYGVATCLPVHGMQYCEIIEGREDQGAGGCLGGPFLGVYACGIVLLVSRRTPGIISSKHQQGLWSAPVVFAP